MKIIFLLIGFLGNMLLATYGQTQAPIVDTDSLWQKKLFDTPDVALPLLIEAAVQHAPEIKILLAESEIAGQELSITRKGLWSSVSLISGYNYGTDGNLSLTQSSVNAPVNSFTAVRSSRYAVGVNMSLPLDRLMTRGNQIKKQKLTLEQTRLAIELKEKDIAKEVMEIYQELILTNRLLRLINETFQSSEINKKMAEKEFLEGETPVSEISRVTEMYLKSAMDRENMQSKYKSLYMFLEQRVGTNIPELLKK